MIETCLDPWSWSCFSLHARHGLRTTQHLCFMWWSHRRLFETGILQQGKKEKILVTTTNGVELLSLHVRIFEQPIVYVLYYIFCGDVSRVQVRSNGWIWVTSFVNEGWSSLPTSKGFTPVGAMLSSPSSPLFPTVEDSSTSVVHDQGFVPVDTVISSLPSTDTRQIR